MKVLFVEDVPGTAYSGDIKNVKNGFARNYLLPRKLAVLATPDQMNRVAGLQSAATKRREATETDMTALAEALEGATITIEGRAGRNDRLYGSITKLVVAEEISKIAGREIDRRRVVLEPIRQLGTYAVPVKLYQGIEPKVTVVVTAPGRERPAEEPVPEATEEPGAEKPKAKTRATGAKRAPRAKAQATVAKDDEPAAVAEAPAAEKPKAKTRATGAKRTPRAKAQATVAEAGEEPAADEEEATSSD